MGNAKYRIVGDSFGKRIKEEERCDIFYIESVPAACMVYCGGTLPVVKAFYVKKSFIFLFDAGPCMRSKLYEKNGVLDTSHAENLNDFLTC